MVTLIIILLQAFSVVFEKAIDRAEPAEEEKQRVINLIDCITYSVFMYTARGLFERDKLIFMAQMTFQVIQKLYKNVVCAKLRIYYDTDNILDTYSTSFQLFSHVNCI